MYIVEYLGGFPQESGTNLYNTINKKKKTIVSPTDVEF